MLLKTLYFIGTLCIIPFAVGEAIGRSVLIGGS